MVIWPELYGSLCFEGQQHHEQTTKKHNKELELPSRNMPESRKESKDSQVQGSGSRTHTLRGMTSGPRVLMSIDRGCTDQGVEELSYATAETCTRKEPFGVLNHLGCCRLPPWPISKDLYTVRDTGALKGTISWHLGGWGKTNHNSLGPEVATGLVVLAPYFQGRTPRIVGTWGHSKGVLA